MINLKSTLEAKFLRSKICANSTFLWKDFLGINKHFVSSKVEIDLEKCGVLIFFMNVKYWWILTTQEVILYKDKQIIFIPLREMDAVLTEQFLDDSVPKQKINQIFIKFRDDIIPIETEKNTWYLIYELLRFAMQKK